jgi:YidC/Oxa1 family membrane protein insertase
MPQEKSKTARIVFPIVMVGVSVLIAWSVLRNTTRQGAKRTPAPPTAASPQAGQPQPGQSPPSPGAPSRETPPAPADAQASPPPPPPEAQPTPAAPAGTAPATARFTAAFIPENELEPLTPLGSFDPGGNAVMELRFSLLGAGLESLTLRDHYETWRHETREVIQKFHPRAGGDRLGFAPLGVSGIDIAAPDGATQFVNLAYDPARSGSYWRQRAPGEFEATILENGREAARFVRRFRLEPGSYDILIEQWLENLTDQPLTVTLYQFGPADLPLGKLRYGGDRRRVRFGYLLSPQVDPSQQIVEARKYLIERADALGRAGRDGVWPDKALWPNPVSQSGGLTLSWVGLTNRYFAVALHPVVTQSGGSNAPGRKAFDLAAKVDRYVLRGPDDLRSVLMLRLTSAPLVIAPGKTQRLNMGVYAGPLSSEFLTAAREPGAAAVGLGRIVVYNLGGPCAWCTFQWIAFPLRAFLGFLDTWIVHDWAMAIIVLVVCVRVVLHPVTKFSQISMMRFSKQFAAIAPKMKAIQEKYRSDPGKMREELGRLRREEHISYRGGAMGCLPALLQMPIWFALFAMLFFTFELRQTPAFFGFFQWLSQSVTGTRWSFLADLSEPDFFIPFGFSFEIPFLNMLMGPIESLNLLPIVLGFVYFVSQKYLTPPPAAPLTPEQEQQMRITKVMMVVLFPLFMYNMPSGLVIYNITSAGLAMLESHYIRKQAAKMDFTPKKRQPRPAVPGQPVPRGRPGFLQRLQERVEERRQLLEKMRQADAKRKWKR